MQNFMVFNNRHYRPFCFANSLKKILSQLFGAKNMAVQVNGLIAVPDTTHLENLYLLSKHGVQMVSGKDLEISRDPILQKQNIIIAKVATQNNVAWLEKEILINPMIRYFQSYLMLEQLKWLQQAQDYVHEHLKNRLSGDHVLTHYDSIQYLFSDFLEQYKLLHWCLNGYMDNPKNEFFDLYRTSLFKAGNILMKLTGARAFVADSVIEMLWLFELLNKFYLVNYE